MEYPIEPGEELREEFEKEYGKARDGYGQWLDMTRLCHGQYRSMVTHFAWAAFRHGRGVFNPNNKESKCS